MSHYCLQLLLMQYEKKWYSLEFAVLVAAEFLPGSKSLSTCMQYPNSYMPLMDLT